MGLPFKRILKIEFSEDNTGIILGGPKRTSSRGKIKETNKLVSTFGERTDREGKDIFDYYLSI